MLKPADRIPNPAVVCVGIALLLLSPVSWPFWWWAGLLPQVIGLSASGVVLIIGCTHLLRRR